MIQLRSYVRVPYRACSDDPGPAPMIGTGSVVPGGKADTVDRYRSRGGAHS